MVALAQNLGSLFEAKYGTIQAYRVGASEHIYRYALVVLNLTDGYLYHAIADVPDTNKSIVVGLALEEVDNSSGIAGAKICRVRRDGKIRRYVAGSADQSYVGRLACISDDQTIQLYTDGTTGSIVIGRITEVISAAEVYVDVLDRPVRIATSEYQ